MNTLESNVKIYLSFCKTQKCLDEKTLKAYLIDLKQFSDTISNQQINDISTEDLESYITILHQTYKPKTAKRKIASVKAFFHYLEYKDIISSNPFHKVQIKFREPIILPKVIPLHIIEQLLRTIYTQHSLAKTNYQKMKTLQDIAIVELLFSTGLRISELCTLKASDVNLFDNIILILGKGSKQRRLQIGNDDVHSILAKYQNKFYDRIQQTNYFFPNKSGQHINDQYVRKMIKNYTKLSNIDFHITPHMFRHTFATSLLETDVDIRYIQEMLGHSSINVTQIYTHVSTSKQFDILKNRHPRKDFKI